MRAAPSSPAATSTTTPAPHRRADRAADGWFRSGDLGRVRDDGYLELHRAQRGEAVQSEQRTGRPMRVEQVLTGYQVCRRAYVAGVQDKRLGEVMITGRYGRGWSPATERSPVKVFDLLRKSLPQATWPPFKVPRKITFLSRRGAAENEHGQGAEIPAGEEPERLSGKGRCSVMPVPGALGEAGRLAHGLGGQVGGAVAGRAGQP